MPQNQFTVPANQKGVVLPGWILTPNSKVIIRWIGGFWTSNPNVPPPQYDANGNPNYKAGPGYLWSGNEGSLIACIGNPAITKWNVGNYGVIGGDGKSAGQLWVACNDDWNGTYGAGYSDNRGTITIQVYPYDLFLQQLSDEKEMQGFIDNIGSEVGINNIDDLKNKIANNDERLFGFSSAKSSEDIGQQVAN